MADPKTLQVDVVSPEEEIFSGVAELKKAFEQGLFKVVADKRDGRILGAHVLGYEAANLIQPLVTAMNLGIDAHTLARGQYWIHPALMEVAENALLGLEVPESGRL